MRTLRGHGTWLSLVVAIMGCGDGKPAVSSHTPSANNHGGAAGVAGSAGAGAPTIENPCGEVDSSLAAVNPAELFALDHVPAFDLALPADVWESLKVHARDEQYVEAQACFEGKAIGRVGLRFKGSYGSLYNCFDSAGVNTCRKLGMKIKFDKIDPELRFYGLKRLNFQSYRYDDSYLRERLSYDLYSAAGIVAPRASWAVLRVNGEAQGLFGMVEEIDGRFTKDRWPDNGDRNLFKELWPGNTSDSAIVAHLETNEEAPDFAAFLAFSKALNAAADADLHGTFATYADVDYWSRYMAVDDAIANFDGITTYYTTGAADAAGNHNFFLYEESANRFTIIPWDLESTLSLSSGFGNVPHWLRKPEDCNLTYRAWESSSLVVIAPGCNRVFRGLAADPTSYHAAARKLLDGPFAEAAMLSNIDRLSSFIRKEASADPHGPSAAAFEGAVNSLRQEIPKLRRRLEFIQTGATAVPLAIELGRVVDFEENDDYGLTMGTMQMSNPNSTASVELDQATPIDGARTLRVDFSFANETEPWQQWTIFRVPFAAGVVDLTKYNGIRLKARSNQDRVLRFDLVSPNDSGTMDGIHFGWDLALKAETTSYEVSFAKAAIPSWAKDPGDTLAEILATVVSLSFQPICNGRNATGQLPEGTHDDGWIEVDDIEIF